MKTIWKYDFAIKDDIEILMRKNAVVLTVQIQKGVPCIWVEFDPDEEERDYRKFKWFGTGHPIPDDHKLKYIGTVLLMNDELVFHLYEKL